MPAHQGHTAHVAHSHRQYNQNSSDLLQTVWASMGAVILFMNEICNATIEETEDEDISKEVLNHVIQRIRL